MEKFYFGKGVLPSFLNELIDRCFGNPLSSDPDTTEWGAGQAGYGWFNTTEGAPKYWDGTVIVTLKARLPASYVIYIRNSIVEAVNCFGEIVASNASFQIVFDDVMAACSDGDLIKVLPGDYKIKNWVITKVVTLEGTQGETVGTIFWTNETCDNIIKITDATHGVTLRNFEISGAGSANVAVGLLVEGTGTRLYNVRVHNCENSAIKLSGYNTFMSSVVISSSKYGIHMVSGTYNPNNLQIIGGRITGIETNGSGIELEAGGTMSIFGLNIESSKTGVTGIHIKKTGDSNIRGFGLRFEGAVATPMENAIKWDSGKGGNDRFYAYTSAYVTNEIVNLPSSSKIKDCANFVTENTVLSPAFAIDGVAVVAVTIPHGLDVTPAAEDCQLTLVEVTDVDDFQIGFIKVDASTPPDATNVYAKVNVTNASATGGATAKLALHVVT